MYVHFDRVYLCTGDIVHFPLRPMFNLSSGNIPLSSAVKYFSTKIFIELQTHICHTSIMRLCYFVWVFHLGC